MKYLTIPEIKKQCVIDEWYDGDNEYLEMIGDAAEDMTEQLLDNKLDDIEMEYGEIPASLRHAMRLLVDYFYATSRGSADTDKEIPQAATLLIKLFRNFK